MSAEGRGSEGSRTWGGRERGSLSTPSPSAFSLLPSFSSSQDVPFSKDCLATPAPSAEATTFLLTPPHPSQCDARLHLFPVICAIDCRSQATSLQQYRRRDAYA